MDAWREAFCQQMREAKPGDAWSLRAEERLEARSLGPGWKEAVQERARASFTCSQCHHTWSSHQVVILFHLYWERSLRQGQVWMQLFRQECHACSSAKKEKPQFTRENMESAIQHLVLDIREKCYRERVQRGELLEVVCEGKGPHKREYCEACQVGLHKGRRGKPDGTLHHGKPDGALHHGKPGRALDCGRSQSPRYTGTPALPSYRAPPVVASRRRNPTRPPSPPEVVTPRCLSCLCCIGILAALVIIIVFLGYWHGWF